MKLSLLSTSLVVSALPMTAFAHHWHHHHHHLHPAPAPLIGTGVSATLAVVGVLLTTAMWNHLRRRGIARAVIDTGTSV
jgi:hypothetical protein